MTRIEFIRILREQGISEEDAVVMADARFGNK